LLNRRAELITMQMEMMMLEEILRGDMGRRKRREEKQFSYRRFLVEACVMGE
jgi:hypothetical protein